MRNLQLLCFLDCLLPQKVFRTSLMAIWLSYLFHICNRSNKSYIRNIFWSIDLFDVDPELLLQQGYWFLIARFVTQIKNIINDAGQWPNARALLPKLSFLIIVWNLPTCKPLLLRCLSCPRDTLQEKRFVELLFLLFEIEKTHYFTDL